ncbi:hypothetical protein RGQ29_025533 [Quercus rubra]|uniref:Verticillium wilt resistance-like protein n=1 Tax=Quercus rubra TaxID=3512 RepID=A0AAN7EYI0_QUERU|nr:hypothetical protein RGQ29_025533 [Quercus rubra]
MEGQTESPANPKRKEKKKGKKGKRRNQNATDHGSHRHGNKRKKKQGRKTYLKREKLGSVAAHRPPEKATTSEESKCNLQHEGRVIGLNLFNESVSGGLDNSSLFSLLYLENLNLAYNDFSNSESPQEFGNLMNLSCLNLANAGFAGQIPSEISNLNRLVTLDLSTSRFFSISMLKVEKPNLATLVQNFGELKELYLDGVNISEPGNEWCQALSSSAPNLRVLSMSDCHLSGPFDPSLSELRSLSIIHLDGNPFNAPVPEFIANFINLTSLHLSFCGLKGTFRENVFQIPTLQTLDLSNNELLHGALPDTIDNLSMLSRLDLSNCNFSGSIPNSMANLVQLVYLDMSFNSFTGPIPSFSMAKNLTQINLFHNKLTGQITSTHWNDLPNLVNLHLSFNSLEGSVPVSLFSLPLLQKLQLSNNQFSGLLNYFYVSSYLLDTLDLSSNNLEGPIPILQTLNLNGNLFKGVVPESLGNCKKLEVLNLGNNKIKDAFPCFLKNLSSLHVLILRSNNFYGSIDCGGPNTSWPMLKIVDLASNKFTGRLPRESLSAWKAMMDDAQSQFEHLQFGKIEVMGCYYQDVITVTNKGLDMELVKILTLFTSIDLSCNNLDGPIPEELGELKSLLVLNLSHNALSGHIPPFMGNLTQLESLDLSSNNLTGEIPMQFEDGLTFLEVLNLSFNQLVGPIPNLRHFATFSEASYEGNEGLCGYPLNKKCTLGPRSSPPPFQETHLNSKEIHLNFINVELGFIFGFGIVIWPLMFWKRWSRWYFKQVDDILIRIFPQLNLGIKYHRRRARINQGRRH